jgi:hypothetical protein
MPIEMSSEREEREENEGKRSERDFRGQGTTVDSLALRHRTVAQVEIHEKEGGKIGLTIACCSARRGPSVILGDWRRSTR